jgi:hypothetical protein
MAADMVSKIMVFCSHLMLIVAQDFVTFSCHESIRSYVENGYYDTGVQMLNTLHQMLNQIL